MISINMSRSLETGRVARAVKRELSSKINSTRGDKWGGRFGRLGLAIISPAILLDNITDNYGRHKIRKAWGMFRDEFRELSLTHNFLTPYYSFT